MGIGSLFSAAAGIAGSIFGAAGSEDQAAAISASDMYKAQVAQNNAKIDQENAAYTMDAGEASATNFGVAARGKIGTMKAQQGANGVDVNSGSTAAVRAGADQTSMLDALTIRDNSARSAYGYEVQSSNDLAEAKLDKMAAANATETGDVSAASSLISGASTVGKAFAGYQTAGGFNFNLGS